MTFEEKAARSAAIEREIERLPELASAKVIMAFAPLPDEANLSALWRRLIARGKTLAFPVLMKQLGAMEAVPVADIDRDLGPGRFGVSQPYEGRAVGAAEIDLIFVPALAYDRKGRRLGRGGGYYDRFLGIRASKAFLCGVVFHTQVLDSVPTKDHDCAVDAIVTDEGLIRVENHD